MRSYSLLKHCDDAFFLVCRIVDNSIPATAFKAMAAPRAPGEREENETEKGLRVSDRGFLNTAVLRSQITFIDGDAGGMLACIIETNGS